MNDLAYSQKLATSVNGGAYIALSDYSQMSLLAHRRLEVTLKVYRRVTRHLAPSESSALSEVSAQSISVPRKDLQHAEGTGPRRDAGAAGATCTKRSPGCEPRTSSHLLPRTLRSQSQQSHCSGLCALRVTPVQNLLALRHAKVSNESRLPGCEHRSEC